MKAEAEGGKCGTRAEGDAREVGDLKALVGENEGNIFYKIINYLFIFLENGVIQKDSDGTEGW